MQKVRKEIFIFITLLLLPVLLFPFLALADVPLKINYQGFLKDSNGDPVTSNLDLTFSLYTVDTGGVAFWTETQTGVGVIDGVFSVQLGEVTPLDPDDFNTDQIYLGVKVGADSEMTPRQPLTSNAFSFRSQAAEEVPNYDTDNDGLIDNDKLNDGISAELLGSGTVDDTEFGYLNGVTSDIQTQIDAKGDGDMLKSTYDTGDNGKIDADKIDSGLSAALIGTASVDNTEFGYLDGVSSAVQTQLDAKGVGDMLKTTYDTTNSGKIDNNKIDSGISAALIGPTTVDNTEFGYLDGVTSAIQTQIDAKGVGDMLKTTYDTTNSGKIDNNKIDSGISAALIGPTTVDNTEFGYLDGVTSAIQTQIDAKGVGDMLKTTYDTTNSGKIDNNKIDSGISAALIGPTTVSNDEFGYLDGATSAIQTQINDLNTNKVSSVTATSNKGLVASGTTSVSLGLITSGCNNGDVMTFDGTNWSCVAPSGGGGLTLEAQTTSGNISAGAIVKYTANCSTGKKLLTGYCYNYKTSFSSAGGYVLSFYPIDSGGSKTTTPSSMVGFSCEFYSDLAVENAQTIAICYE